MKIFIKIEPRVLSIINEFGDDVSLELGARLVYFDGARV